MSKNWHFSSLDFVAPESVYRPALITTGSVVDTPFFFDRRSLLRFIIDQLSDLERERLDGLFFNSKGKFLSRYIISNGTSDRVWVPMRELMSLCLEIKAATFILAHNHTTGFAYPSRMDVDATKSVKRAAESLGLCFLDHFVVADGICVSMRNEGCFSKSCRPFIVEPMRVIIKKTSLKLAKTVAVHSRSVNRSEVAGQEYLGTTQAGEVVVR